MTPKQSSGQALKLLTLSTPGLLYFRGMIRHTFKKSERLTNKKTFDQLFKSGKSIAVSPFRFVWIETKKDGRVEAPISIGRKNGKQPSNHPSIQPSSRYLSGLPTFQCLVGISVPKKSFAKAVDRNTLKRRIREAYRKNKHLLYESLQNKNFHIALMVIYIAKEELPYSEIEKKMVVSLRKIIAEIGIME